MQELHGHISQSTAFVVPEYPWGFRMRTAARFWIEAHPKRGFRVVQQTQDPRSGRWCKPKAGTYSKLAASMYLDDAGHVQWSSLDEYSTAEDVARFVASFPGAITDRILVWCVAKAAFYKASASGKVRWTINGVPQDPTEAEQVRDEAKALAWSDLIQRVREALPARLAG